MAAADVAEVYNDSLTAGDTSLSCGVSKENGLKLKASSPQTISEAATDNYDNSVSLSNGHSGENGYSENGHQFKYEDLDIKDSNSYSGIKTSSVELYSVESGLGVKELYTTLSNGDSNSDYHLSELNDYNSMKKQQKNGDVDTCDYDLKAAPSRSSTIMTSSNSSSKREVSNSDSIPALYDRSYIDDIIKRALNPTAPLSSPPTRRVGSSGMADDVYVTNSHHQHRLLLDVAGKLSDDDLEPHHRQGHQDSAGAKTKVSAVDKYDAYDYSSPTCSPGSTRRRFQGASADVGGGELDNGDKYYKDSRLGDLPLL